MTTEKAATYVYPMSEVYMFIIKTRNGGHEEQSERFRVPYSAFVLWSSRLWADDTRDAGLSLVGWNFASKMALP